MVGNLSCKGIIMMNVVSLMYPNTIIIVDDY